MAEIKITANDNDYKILAAADPTGLSPLFVAQNMSELKAPFVDLGELGFSLDNFTLPMDIGQYRLLPTQDNLKVPPERLEPKTPDMQQQLQQQQDFYADTGTAAYPSKWLQRFAGRNITPAEYEKMSFAERLNYKINLTVGSFLTKIGLGAVYNLQGVLQKVLPENMEEHLVTDKKISEGRLDEDVFIEKKRLRELTDKQRESGLTEEEKQELAELELIVPQGFVPNLPYNVGRGLGFLASAAASHYIAQSIPVPGSKYNLSDYLSRYGKTVIGKKFLDMGIDSGNQSKVLIAFYKALSESMANAGPAALELFSFGALTSQKDLQGQASPVTEGIKMLPWAAPAVLLGPSAKAAAETKIVSGILDIIKPAIAKTSAVLADKLARMQLWMAKKTFVDNGIRNADEMSILARGTALNPAERKEATRILTDAANRAAELSGKSKEEIIDTVTRLTGEQLSKTQVGSELVIPQAQRAITAGEAVADDIFSRLAQKTNLLVIRQPDRNYAILNRETFEEIAVDIKRKNISKVLNDIIFGVEQKLPSGAKIPKPKTPLTVTEEAALKRQLSILQTVSNDAYKAGFKSASEKWRVKTEQAKEHIATIKTDNLRQWENVELARSLVKDFVPPEEQGLFLNRLIKARTEGGLASIIDDIASHVKKAELNQSIDNLNFALKKAAGKYSDKTGRYAKAPDEVKPVLEQIDKAVSGINKLSQTAQNDVKGFNAIIDDMFAGLRKMLGDKSDELADFPASFLEDLDNLYIKSGEKLTAENINLFAQLAQMVLHRAEQAQHIQLGPHKVLASEVIKDSISNIRPRPEPLGTGLWGLFKRIYSVETKHPSTLVMSVFGDKSAAKQLINNLYNGETASFGVMRQAYDIAKEYLAKNNLPAGILNNLQKTVKVSFGGKVYPIKKDDLLALFCTIRDPWGFEQLTKASHINIGGRIIKATTDEMAAAISALTDEEKAFAGMWYYVNNNYLANAVNKTSLLKDGIKIATSPLYYPTHRVRYSGVYGKSMAVNPIEQESYFMPRIGGAAPMRIVPFTHEFGRYIQSASYYSEMAIPLQSIKAVLRDKQLNMALDAANRMPEWSVLKKIIAQADGILTGSSSMDVIAQKLFNNYTQAVLGARISPIGSQIASVPAAKEFIPAKYFSPSDLLGDAQALNELNSSDFFWHRWRGRRVSIELGDLSSKSDLETFVFDKQSLSLQALRGLVWGDKKAIIAIYQAAKRYVSDTKGLKGSDLINESLALTEYVTRQTQPNWSVLTRSLYASSPSVLARTFSMFRTALEAQANIISRANIRWQDSAKTAKDFEQLVNSYSAVIESGLSAALWKTLWLKTRQAGIETAAAWLGVYAPQNDKTFLEDFTKNTASAVSSLVPVGQQIESVLSSAYDYLKGKGYSENTSLDPYSSIVAAASDITKYTVGLIKKASELHKKRTGLDKNFADASLEDMLNELTYGASDRKAKQQQLRLDMVKTVASILENASIFTGVPVVGVLNEWAFPSLKRSEYNYVNRINELNSSNPVEFQRDLDRFMRAENILKQKEQKKGLSLSEAVLLRQMTDLRYKGTSSIENWFNIEDRTHTMLGGEVEGILDIAGLQLRDFMKENQKNIDKLLFNRALE